MFKFFTRALSVIVACSLLLSVEAMADNRDFAGIGRYAEANKSLSVPAKGEKRVVFLGNSITDFWINHSPEFFESNNYIDRGISGQTSYQFLLRFREDVINLKPALVVINADTNDVAENTCPFNLDVTFGNIVSMVELAKANEIKVVLASVLPASVFSWNRNITDVADKIAALNDRIKTYAAENHIPYVDYYSAMVSGPERSLDPRYTKDGVHPIKEGYKVMESLVHPVIQKALK